LSVVIPEGSVAFDSSVIIAILEGTDQGMAVLEAVTSLRLTPHTSWVNIMETEYIICRKVGHELARKSVKAFLESSYVAVEEDPVIHHMAAMTKCERSISIADCYTFAVAELTSSTPLFASKEDDIAGEMKKKPFEIQPVFLS
jgi:uncharacterized protein with PIN domain